MLGLGTGINKLSAAEAAAIAGRLPGFTGLLDETFGATAEAAYSVRQLSGSQSVAMTIRRDSDNAETDIGFDSNGNLDEAAINTFCSGTTCKVSVWKDQSGNGNDASQTTAANQPTIYTGGALVKRDGRVALQGTSSSKLLLDSTARLSNEATIFTLCTTSDVDSPWGGDQSGADQLTWVYFPSVNTYWRLINSTQNTSFNIPFTVEDSRVLQAHNRNSSNSTSLTLSGTLADTKTFAGDMPIKAVMSSNWFNYDGIGQEIIFYNSEKSSADQTSIEENIGDYFTQNTPLLDTYTGAAAAYSLRKLRSDYSGNAVKVRRASDNVEADIGFNVFKELDTVALAAHCGSSDGFVSVWYDQSSSNNATQTTAANQPKIYDGTTGVVTKNGKPTISAYDGGTVRTLVATVSSDNLHTNNEFTQVAVFEAGSSGHVYLNNFYTTFPHWRVRSGSTTNSTAATPTALTGGNNSFVQTLGFLSRSGNSVESYENNVLAINGTDTASITTYNATVGIGRVRYGGNVQELIIWNSDQSSNRTNIEDNINTFYSIY